MDATTSPDAICMEELQRKENEARQKTQRTTEVALICVRTVYLEALRGNAACLAAVKQIGELMPAPRVQTPAPATDSNSIQTQPIPS